MVSVMDSVSCMLLFLFTITAVQALCSLLAKGGKAKYKLPPGPSPLPLIGNLLEMGNNPHQSLAKLANIHGPIMSLKLGQLTTIVISSADLAKEVFQTHDQSLSNRNIPDALTALSHKDYSVAFMPISPRWRSLRKICNTQLFANKTLDASQNLRRKKLQELLTDIHHSSLKHEAVEIGSLAFKTSLNFLSNTIFSLDLVHSTGRVGEFKDLVEDIMREVGTPNLADFFPVLRMVDPQGVRRRTGSSTAKTMDIIRSLINQRLNVREGRFSDTNDMLDTLLNISQENNQEMDKLQIEHLCQTLFIAGTDTVASTLEWAMAEILCNSEVMLKAKEELEKSIGKGNTVEESDIARLPYLQAIIKETFRLHPPVPFLIPREAITNVEMRGYTIPKGAQVLVNVWAIGRDSSIWENPKLFSPERFLKSEIDIKGHDFELAPFGAGRRICPALPLAMRTLILMLGSLINSFDWKFEDGIKLEDINMDDKFGITIRRAQPLRVVPIKLN